MEIILDHEGKKLKFRRVYGASAWPGQDGSGWNTVIGEEIRHAMTQKREHVETIHYHVLYAKESKNLTELVQDAIDAKARFKAEQWFGRTSYQPARDFLDTWNRESYRSRGATFHPIDPPYVDERPNRGRIEYHVNELHQIIASHILTPPELEGTSLWPHLNEFSKEELLRSTDLEHSAVASLAYASVALKLRPTREQEIRENQEAEALAEILCGD